MYSELRGQDEAALITYWMPGYPDLKTSEEIAQTLIDAGSDALEIGVPFSDPLADGATVQRAGERALQQGISVADALGLVRRLRNGGATAPLLLMGYYNPFLRFGLARLAAVSADAGVNGFIVPDLPPEEAVELRDSLDRQGLDLIGFAAPSSTDARLANLDQTARGFVYCVSLTGTTGARASLSENLEVFIGRVRARTSLPLAVGFGVSRPEHVQRVARLADGAVVASALIDLWDKTDPSERLGALSAYTRELKAATRRGQLSV